MKHAARKAHAKCRPPKAHVRTLRLREDGRWGGDNGDPGLAFIRSADEEGAMATIWVANCKCTRYLDCPISIAFARATAIGFSGASVIGVRASPRKRVARVRRKKARR